MSRTRFLSNRRLTVLVTEVGTGFVSGGGRFLTSWTGDRTEDCEGLFVYVRDLDDGALWSIGHQPTRAAGQSYEMDWRVGRITFRREDFGIQAQAEMCVHPERDIELCHILLRNKSSRTRRIELTTYAEVALNDLMDHRAHPAFSKLFLGTEALPKHRALLVHRRPRSPHESPPWFVHALLWGDDFQYETERRRFVGRGRDLQAPLAMLEEGPLSGTFGYALDPIVSLRRCVRMEVGGTASLCLLWGMAPSRESTLELLERVPRAHELDAAFQMAESAEGEILRSVALNPAEAEFYQSIAGSILYGDPRLRTSSEVLRRARDVNDLLARHGLDIFRPFVVVHANLPEVRACLDPLLKGHAYWSALGLSIEMLILGAGGEIPGGTWEGVRQLRLSDLGSDEIDAMNAAARLVVDRSIAGIGGGAFRR